MKIIKKYKYLLASSIICFACGTNNLNNKNIINPKFIEQKLPEFYKSNEYYIKKYNEKINKLGRFKKKFINSQDTAMLKLYSDKRGKLREYVENRIKDIKEKTPDFLKLAKGDKDFILKTPIIERLEIEKRIKGIPEFKNLYYTLGGEKFITYEEFRKMISYFRARALNALKKLELIKNNEEYLEKNKDLINIEMNKIIHGICGFLCPSIYQNKSNDQGLEDQNKYNDLKLEDLNKYIDLELEDQDKNNDQELEDRGLLIPIINKMDDKNEIKIFYKNLGEIITDKKRLSGLKKNINCREIYYDEDEEITERYKTTLNKFIKNRAECNEYVKY